jgi:hypothetical protein
MSSKKKTTTQSDKTPAVKKADSPKSSQHSQTITYEYRPAEVIAELNSENESLREKLRQLKDPRPNPQPNLAQKERQSYLNDIASAYNHQLSRMSLNVEVLIEVSNRIQINKEETAQCGQPDPADLTTRLSNYNNYFSYQNDRLEAALTKLQNLV